MSSSPVSISEENALQLVSSPFDQSEFDAGEGDDDERPKSRRSCLIRKTSARLIKKQKEKDVPPMDKEQADLDREHQNQTPVVEDSDFVYVLSPQSLLNS